MNGWSNVMLMSIDPGINTTGISIIDINGKFDVVDTVLVNNKRKFTPQENELVEIYGDRYVKAIRIIENIKNLMSKHEIKELAIEAPFYNPRMPAAFASLLEVIFSIKYSIVKETGLTMSLVEPLLVKKMFAKTSKADKDYMRTSLVQLLEDKTISMSKDISLLSEHEVDSIAVGYTHVKKRGNEKCLNS